MGGTFFSAMHLLCHRARWADFSFFDLRLLPILDFDSAPPLPPLGFCLLKIFSERFRLPFSVVPSAARANNSASLLDNNPQTWLSVWGHSMYLYSANFRSCSMVSEGVGILYSSWASSLRPVLDQVCVLAEFKGAPHNFELVREY